MFEAVELGRRIGKAEFNDRAPQVHTGLLAVQRSLEERNIPLIIIVAGVETAGKGDVVKRLNRWLDARSVETHAFWDPSDEEEQRPYYWRFWRRMPQRGRTTVMFGSWYSRPIIEHAHERMSENEFDRMMARNARLERMLTEDGALIVKFWMHLSADQQQRRLEKQKGKRRDDLLEMQQRFARRYPHFVSTAERAIRQTDTGECPWFLIECGNRRYRDISVGEILLETIRSRLARTPAAPAPDIHPVTPAADRRTILDQVDLNGTLAPKHYRKQLRQAQTELSALAWELRALRRPLVALFEGWDAAGKGGVIRRLTAAIDPRLYRIISVAAPSDEELARHYLWRFWRHLPAGGRMTIYDRSWYGRVLVERVEELAAAPAWQRAYAEINDFEEQLHEHGILLFKFWIHLSPEEQLRRFKEREGTPWKQHKITDEDWRNRDRWDDYELAINDMITRTSTEYAPWHLVAGNDKRHARVEVLRTMVDRLRSELGGACQED